jgi:hypothetical protein
MYKSSPSAFRARLGLVERESQCPASVGAQRTEAGMVWLRLNVLGCLRDTIPNLSRSAPHRCLQRHGISRLPKEETSDKRHLGLPALDADHGKAELAQP